MKVTVERGKTLYDAMQKQNIAPERPCAGRGTCGGCMVEVSGFGRVKACQFRLAGSYEVTPPAVRCFDVVGTKEALSVKGDAAVVLVDIGTTTVALCALFRGKQVSRGFTNPQRAFGADVMSRIEQANAGNGAAMQELLAAGLRSAIDAMLAELGCDTDVRIFLGANTTMLHILNGYSCKGLGEAPFTPVSVAALTTEYRADDRIFHVTELPGISTFVGADITGGIYALDMMEACEPVLLLDLGTNGEMALGCKGKLFVTSTAAGPALEGSELAISLHASGLLALLHSMKQNGAMDETGLLAEPYFAHGYPVGENLVITQQEIRDLQMAKAAIRAGVEILLRQAQLTPQEVEKVYLAGGMGYYVDARDAIAVGLLPAAFEGRVEAVGNSCLKGLAKYADCERTLGAGPALEKLAKIPAAAKEIVLAEHPLFADLYVNYMNF